MPFIRNKWDEEILLEIMRSVLKVQKLWISVEEGMCNTVSVRKQQNIFLAEQVVISLYRRVSLMKLPHSCHEHWQLHKRKNVIQWQLQLPVM